MTNIVLEDDIIGTVTCPEDTLEVGAEMRCTATGTAERGQYANTATVTGIDSLEQTVTDEDPSHYFGFIVEVDIEKFTNGEDADEPTGPEIPVGDPVTWTYEVTNPGDFPVADVVVTDDQGVTPVFQGGDTNGDDLLDPGETWLYEATGTAEFGQYANVATVEGNQPVRGRVHSSPTATPRTTSGSTWGPPPWATRCGSTRTPTGSRTTERSGSRERG